MKFDVVADTARQHLARAIEPKRFLDFLEGQIRINRLEWGQSDACGKLAVVSASLH